MYLGYHDHMADKGVPNFSPQDSLLQESLTDEPRKLKNVYYDPRELNPLNFRGAYVRSKIQSVSQSQDNSINLTPGTVLSLGKYSGKDVTLHIEDSSVSMSWGSDPMGSEYVNKFNDTLRRLLNGAVDENGIPDMSKLSKEQLAVLEKIQKNHQSMIVSLGGVEQYEYIRRIGESFDALIRVANGQMPRAALSHEDHLNIKAGLEMVGIDTSRPFYINGQKFYFSEGGSLRYSE